MAENHEQDNLIKSVELQGRSHHYLHVKSTSIMIRTWYLPHMQRNRPSAQMSMPRCKKISEFHFSQKCIAYSKINEILFEMKLGVKYQK